MAVNFWASTHRMNWLLSRQELIDSRKEDYLHITEQELIKVNIWFAKLMTDLGRRLQVRQIVIATALTYFKRFYTKNSYRRTEPYLVAATCMYLACKIEESPHHIKTVISEMKKLTEDKGGFPYENQKVAEMEFYLMEELNFNMIVFHPYRTLKALADEVLGDKNEDMQIALFIVNDTYRTDMCLLYPPHVIAAAALYLSIAIKEGSQSDDNGGGNGQGVTTRNSRRGLTSVANAGNGSNNETSKVEDIRQWFALLNVDFEQITYIVQEMISLYELWEEKPREIQEILQKLKK